MNRKQAKKLAKKLYNDGMDLNDISDAVYKEGYASQKTGGKLTIAGINSLMNDDKWPSHTKNKCKSAKTDNNVKNTKFEIISRIMDLEICSEEKTALIGLVVEIKC